MDMLLWGCDHLEKAAVLLGAIQAAPEIYHAAHKAVPGSCRTLRCQLLRAARRARALKRMRGHRARQPPR